MSQVQIAAMRGPLPSGVSECGKVESVAPPNMTSTVDLSKWRNVLNVVVQCVKRISRNPRRLSAAILHSQGELVTVREDSEEMGSGILATAVLMAASEGDSEMVRSVPLRPEARGTKHRWVWDLRRQSGLTA